jgi:hypothetical protein
MANYLEKKIKVELKKKLPFLEVLFCHVLSDHAVIRLNIAAHEEMSGIATDSPQQAKGLSSLETRTPSSPPTELLCLCPDRRPHMKTNQHFPLSPILTCTLVPMYQGSNSS